MRRLPIFPFALLTLMHFILCPSSLAQEWEFRPKPRGTLKVVHLGSPTASIIWNYSAALVTSDINNKHIPWLAEDWRWIDDKTIEFKLRKGVTFHNGERFDAEAVRVNWEAYRSMDAPESDQYHMIPDETILEVIDEYKVRFTFPEPEGLAFPKFWTFRLYAPAFFSEHKFEEMNWNFFPEPGPWGAGQFKLVEGGVPYGRPTERVVLEAFEDFWHPSPQYYPKVKRVIFENSLIGNRKEAMRLCREEEGAVDIVSHIRPLDTLKVAESPFAKVVKSRDDSLLWGVFNQRKKDSKWRDIRLRKAVNYAINREELWKYAAKGNAYNLGGFIPIEGYEDDPDLEPYVYDTERARSLLAEAGYPDGFDVELIAAEAWGLENQIISKMLGRIGLEVKLEVYTVPEFLKRFFIPMLDKPPQEQEWDIAIGASGDVIGHKGAMFFHFFTEQSLWRWVEVDPAFDAMWQDMIHTRDLKAQQEMIRQMGLYVYEKAYNPFIYSPITLYAVNKEVNFVPYKSQRLVLWMTRVSDNHWSIRGENQ